MGRAPRPAVPRDRAATPRAWCCASARRCATGSPATRSPCTATTSTTRTRRRTTTRCSRPTSASGASRRTSAASPRSRVVKANQLMPKPAHLTWEEAACNALRNSTSYRMIVSPNGAQMTQGQTVLIWGASGGIGAYACQYVLNGGGTPVGGGVVARARRAAARDGRRARDRPQGRGLPVLERRAHPGPGGVAPPRQEDPRARRAPTPTSCSSTRAARRWARRCSSCKRGGMIITCAATTGFMIEYDNRYLWMNLKTLKGCHFANYREAWEANRLDLRGQDPPDAVEGVRARPDRRGRVPGAPQPARGQGRRAGARARGGARRHRPRDARASSSTRSRCSGARRARAGTLACRCSPRSTTSPSRSTTSRPRSSTTERRTACEVEHREVVERDGVEEALLQVADSYIQLLTPVRDDSPVAKYLERKGEGLHHVGYRVDDCAAALDRVKAEGSRSSTRSPAPGSRGTTVAFVHPKAAFGTLIELVEEPSST